MSKISDTVIILLDQSIGELRTEENQVVGIDLWPNTHLQLDRLAKAGYSVILVITQRITADDLETVKKGCIFAV